MSSPSVARALALVSVLALAACRGGTTVRPGTAPDRQDAGSTADSVLDARVDSAADRVLDSVVTGGPESTLTDTMRLPADSLR